MNRPAYSRALRLAVIMVFVATSHAMATSVLLAEFQRGIGYGSGHPSFTDITAFSFGLVYGDINTFPFDTCVGCELSIPVGQMGVFTLNASTSPDWADIVTHLTNGIDERLWSFVIVHHPAVALGDLRAGGAAPESFLLNGNPDLQGAHIDFIRLIVNRIEIRPFCCAGGGGFDIGTDITWQIWGTPEPLHVAIDIKPGSDPNCFNNNTRGVIPIAILSSANFNATHVDPSTVQLAGLAVKVAGKSNKYLAHTEDVNSDGLIDLVVQIEDTDQVFTTGTTTATLTGNLYNGTPIEGEDDICIVP